MQAFNLSTDMNSFCPPLSVVKFLFPACMSLNGPSYRLGRVYIEHSGEQKETEIALSCGMEDGILRWAWVPACELDPGVAAVGSDALAGNCD